MLLLDWGYIEHQVSQTGAVTVSSGELGLLGRVGKASKAFVQIKTNHTGIFIEGEHLVTQAPPITVSYETNVSSAD